jgi:hypothetical protein
VVLLGVCPTGNTLRLRPDGAVVVVVVVVSGASVVVETTGMTRLIRVAGALIEGEEEVWLLVVSRMASA